MCSFSHIVLRRGDQLIGYDISQYFFVLFVRSNKPNNEKNVKNILCVCLYPTKPTAIRLDSGLYKQIHNKCAKFVRSFQFCKTNLSIAFLPPLRLALSLPFSLPFPSHPFCYQKPIASLLILFLSLEFRFEFSREIPLSFFPLLY